MKYRILLSILVFLTTGCTKDDVSYCKTFTSFKCSFELNNEHTDQFAKLVNKVDLYIFDDSDLFVKHISQTDDKLPEGYAIVADLRYGTYTAVLYGTNGNNELSVGTKQGDLTTLLTAMKEGESHMSDMRLMLNNVTGQASKDLDVVLHGMVSQFTVTSKPKTHNVSFIRNTSTVELHINGLEYIISETSSLAGIAVRVDGNNKAYLYDNTLDMELAKVTYAPYSQEYINSILISRLSVLRLFKEQPMQLKIYNGNDVLWELDLMAEIMKSPAYSTNEDLDREDKFVVKIDITTAGDFTIIVNGWTTTIAGEIVG